MKRVVNLPKYDDRIVVEAGTQEGDIVIIAEGCQDWDRGYQVYVSAEEVRQLIDQLNMALLELETP